MVSIGPILAEKFELLTPGPLFFRTPLTLLLPNVGIRGQLRDEVQLFIQISFVRNKLLLPSHWHCQDSVDPGTEVLLLRSLVIPKDGLEHRLLHMASRVSLSGSMRLKNGNFVLNLELGRVLIRLHGWRLFMPTLVGRFLLLF